jgi:hypothetical protein
VPDVIYTPAENATGEDRFSFSASNGITESRTADVLVRVMPSDADTVPPAVLWTEPDANGTLHGIQTTPVYTDDAGLIYAPMVVIQFTEKVSSTTVTSATLHMVGNGGRSIAKSITYNSASGQATIVPREALQSDIRYTVTITGVKDLVGNQMVEGYTFGFGQGSGTVYLPLVARE